jgi:hypothetical protein
MVKMHDGATPMTTPPLSSFSPLKVKALPVGEKLGFTAVQPAL